MTSHTSRGSSIFVRILLVFLCVNVMTSGVLIYIAYTFSSASIEKRTKETIVQQVTTMHDNFEKQYGANLKRTMQTLISSALLDEYLSVSEVEKRVLGKKVERLFLQTIQNFESYHSIYFIDPTGDVKISVEGTAGRKESLNVIHQGGSAHDPDDTPGPEATRRLFSRLEATPLLLSSGYMEWFMPPRDIQIEGPFVDAKGAVTSLVGVAKLDL